MNLRVPLNVGNFLTSCKPVSFSRRTLLHRVSKYVSKAKWQLYRTNCCNSYKSNISCIIYMFFDMIFTINSNYMYSIKWISLCSGFKVCTVWGRNWLLCIRWMNFNLYSNFPPNPALQALSKCLHDAYFQIKILIPCTQHIMMWHLPLPLPIKCPLYVANLNQKLSG
jgi:hypothetical protein